MQVTETLNEGLKRKLSVTIPAADLNTRLGAKLEELKGQANIKGFRPGKVPLAHIKKMFGRSAMSEVMTDAINSTVSDTLDERKERYRTNIENMRKNDIADWGAKFLGQLNEADSELSLFADFPLESNSDDAPGRTVTPRQRLQS